MIGGTATAYYVLSKPGGRSIFWTPLLVAAIAVIAAGVLTGAPLWWTAREKRDELGESEDNAQLEQILEGRNEIVIVLEILADAQNELVAAPVERQPEYLGRFKQSVVEGAVRAVKALCSENMHARAMFIEYNEASDSPPSDSSVSNLEARSTSSFSIVAVAGQPPPTDLDLDVDSEFSSAAKAFLDPHSPSFFIADKKESVPDRIHLKFRDDADHCIRARVASGRQSLGILCVDTWDTQVIPHNEVQPVILMLARLLAAGVAGTRVTS
jgi:hypothetical protein